MRGPAVLPTVPGRPVLRTAKERFDDLALAIVTEVDERWQHRLGIVEYAVEDTPQLPDDWSVDRVPLSSLVRGAGATPTASCCSDARSSTAVRAERELEAMVLTVVVEQVAELLGIEASEVDPRYEGGL